VRVWTQRYDKMLAAGPTAFHDPQLEAFLEAHPEWRFQDFTEKIGLTKPAEKSDREWAFEQVMSEHAEHGQCTYANGVAHEMALGAALSDAAAAAGVIVDRDEYVGQWIKLVACHEVGHTLGLRHNFKASAWKSLSDIIATEDPSVPTTASVMDYNP